VRYTPSASQDTRAKDIRGAGKHDASTGMAPSAQLINVMVAALVFFSTARSVRAQQCDDVRFSTLPNAEEGLYPPDRFVLRLRSATCRHPPLDVTLDRQEIEGTQELFVAGQDAWLIWRPVEALEVSARYDIHGGDAGHVLAFTLPALIRKPDVERDGRGADPFSSLEWRSSEQEVEIDRACCSTADYEYDFDPSCQGLTARRPVLEASGTAPPWFVYWLESDSAAVFAYTSSGPFFELNTPWKVSAALHEPSDSLCVRILARNLLTDELHIVEHCAAVPESAAFETGGWELDWVDGCFSPPGAKCDPFGQRCRTRPDELREAWCGASLEACFETHGNEKDCGARICAAAWGRPDDEEPSPSTSRSASTDGCSAHSGSSSAPHSGLWVLGVLLARAARTRQPKRGDADQERKPA
jgi:hypothetical protein